MIIILKRGADREKVEELKASLTEKGLKLHLSDGLEASLIGLIGDTSHIQEDQLRAIDVVEDVKRIREPYKKANRSMHPDDTVVDICGHKIGGGHFQVIAGPCSVETKEQMTEVAFDVKKSRSMHPDDTVVDICGHKIGGGHFQVIAGPCSVETKEQMTEVAFDVKKSGANLLRGGAFKPRTSPYSFQGLGREGLDLLLEAKKATGLPVVTEIMRLDHLEFFEDVDVIQVGTRNMQNFELLKELGKLDKPILLKRGMANTLDELLMSAEYIMAGGNEKVILCERGIRTFETSMRNTLDISAIPMLKKKSHLPVIIDPSHASGQRFMVEPLTMAAIAAGADGVMIEVHNNPENILWQVETKKSFSVKEEFVHLKHL